MERGTFAGSPGRKLLAMFTASTGLSFLAFHSIFLSILTPLPHLFVSLRLGRWAAYALPAVCALITLVSGSQVSAAYLMQFGIPAIAFAEGMRRGFSVEKSFVCSVTTVMLFAFFAIASYSSSNGLGMSEAVRMFTETIVIQSVAINEKAGGNTAQLAQFKALAPELGRLVARLYPAMIMSAALIMFWVNVMLLGKVLQHHSLKSPFGELSLWKAPERLIWGIVVGGIAVMAGSGYVRDAAVNALIVLCVIYFFQGMAILSYFFRKRGFSSFLKGAAYFLAVRYMSIVVVVLGIFDMWADFRRLSPKEEKKPED